MTIVRNVLAGTATKYVLLAVNVVLGVLLLPFTIQHLGTADYGLWMLVVSLTYYFQLLDLGYGTGVVRHVCDADARGDIEMVNKVLSTFFVVFAGLGLVAAAGVAVLVVTVVPRFPNLTPDQIWKGQVVLAILGARMAIGLPMTVFGAATTARQRFALNNTVAVVVALVNGAVTYLVLSAGYGLVPLVASTATVGIASYAAYVWTAKRAMPELRLRPSSFSRPLVREVTSFSAYLFLISIATQIGFNLDNLVIGAALGTSAVAIYAVASRIADYQRQLCNQFNGLLFPVVVRLDAAERAGAVREVMIDATRLALSLVTVVTICVIAFGRPLIERWVGEGFEAAVLPLYALAAAGIVLVAQGPLGAVLLGTGRHRFVAYTAMGEALANLVLSVLLVRQFGIAGVAVGTAVPVFVANLGVLLPAACRQVNMPLVTFVRTVSRAPLAGAAPAALVCAMLRTWAPAESLTAILLQSALVGAVYVVALYTIGLERETRARYLRHLRHAVQATPLGARLREAVP